MNDEAEERLSTELNAVPKGDDFRYTIDDVVEGWRARGIGLPGVEAILAFIESNPDLDYGAPGALVHFAETFHRKGYEAALLRSFVRQPTILTAWMLNRLLNGTEDPAERRTYREAFERAAANSSLNEPTRAEITHYLGGIRG